MLTSMVITCSDVCKQCTSHIVHDVLLLYYMWFYYPLKYDGRCLSMTIEPPKPHTIKYKNNDLVYLLLAFQCQNDSISVCAELFHHIIASLLAWYSLSSTLLSIFSVGVA